MLKKILLDQERILVHDQLSYMAGPVQITSEVILTNHRILVLPHAKWTESLGYQRKNIIWDDVRSVSLSKLDKNLQIETKTQTISLWGRGAKRLFGWIEKWRQSDFALDTAWSILEKRQIVLCEDILVSTGIGLAMNGDIHLTRRGFSLGYQGLEWHEKEFQWSDLSGLQYTSMSQKLRFTTKDDTITVQGNQAQLLHHILNVFSNDDIFVDCLWQGSWEGKQSNSGFIMLGQQGLYLFPCNRQASLTNKPYIKIPCQKIQHFERVENILKVFTSKGQVWDLSISMPSLWMGYMTRMLLYFWDSRPELRKQQLMCAKIHNQKDAVTFGHMTVGPEMITFEPNGLRPKTEFSAFEIVKLNKRSSRLTIQYDVRPEGFEFTDEDQVAQMAEKIEPKLSPMSVSFIGKVEPTDSIIGHVKRLGVYMDGSLLVSINNATVYEETGVLKFRTKRFSERVFIPHNIQVEIDIISRRGHYVFFAQVLENNLNSPDIDGQYTLHIQQIGHVRLINQRAAFRVPTSTPITFTLENCPITLDRNTARMVDLSSGGCRLEYDDYIEEMDAFQLQQPQTNVIVHIPLEKVERKSRGKFHQLDKKKKIIEQVPFPAKIRRLFQPEDSNKAILGLEFLENTPSNEHRLMKKILLLERLLIQRHKSIVLKSGD